MMAKFRFLADRKVENPSIYQAHLRILDPKGETNYVRLVCNSYYIATTLVCNSYYVATTLVCNISNLQVKSRLPILRTLHGNSGQDRKRIYVFSYERRFMTSLFK